MIRTLTAHDSVPWDLLLNADPDRNMVAAYLEQSRVFVVEGTAKGLIGVLVMQPLAESHHYEIMNVSVAPNQQGQGIGKQLMKAALADILTEDPIAVIWVKTGDLTIEAIGLYQSVGFEIVDVVKDYFTKHYPEPIYEHGQILRHQVVMRLKNDKKSI